MSLMEHHVEKDRYCQRTIREGAQSGVSIRQFCRQRRLKEGRFYWRHRRLKIGRQQGTMRRHGTEGGAATFAAVGDESAITDGGIKLALGDGPRDLVRMVSPRERISSHERVAYG